MHFSGPSFACAEAVGASITLFGSAAADGAGVVTDGFDGAVTGVGVGSLAMGGAGGVADALEGSAGEFPGVAFSESFPAGAAEGAAAGAGSFMGVEGLAAGTGLCEGAAVGTWGAGGGFAVPQPRVAKPSTLVIKAASGVGWRMGIPWKSGPSIDLCAPWAPYGLNFSTPVDCPQGAYPSASRSFSRRASK